MPNLRTLQKYAILTLSVVGAAVVEGFITKGVDLFFAEPTYLSALIGMVVLVVIYVPLFGLIGQYIERGSKGYVQVSKEVVARNRKLGVIVGTVLALVVLFVLFAMAEYDLYIYEDLPGWLGL